MVEKTKSNTVVANSSGAILAGVDPSPSETTIRSPTPVPAVELSVPTATDHSGCYAATVSLDQVVPAPLISSEGLYTSTSAANTDTAASEDCNPPIITRLARYAHLSGAWCGGRSRVQP